jgi:hypothetical protein
LFTAVVQNNGGARRYELSIENGITDGNTGAVGQDMDG